MQGKSVSAPQLVLDAASSTFRLQGDAISLLEVAAQQACILPPRDQKGSEQIAVRSTQVRPACLPASIPQHLLCTAHFAASVFGDVSVSQKDRKPLVCI